MSQRIALIGECMLELTGETGDRSAGALPMSLSYGGDTLNAAVYLARLGSAVDYVTDLGDDALSAWMVGRWRAEGVGCDLIGYRPGSLPGLYMVETDQRGERSFHYWRDASPARRLFEDPVRVEALFEQFAHFDFLCLSGISIAIYGEASRRRLFSKLEAYRSDGGRVVFDGNYRPRLWPGTSEAQEAYESMYRLTDIALPTLEDEQGLFGDADRETVIERLRSWGVAEIALKMGAEGCLVVNAGEAHQVPVRKVPVIDTTSAGDSFNAGYLAARLQGLGISEAASAGHRLAAAVIQHRGAIIPRDAMPD